MVEYEWARTTDGRFIAYCHDTTYNKKMVVVGNSHKTICHNFAVLLYRHKVTHRMNSSRFIQAMEPNSEILERYSDIRRGKFILDKEEIVTVKEKRELAKQQKEERDNLAQSLIENYDNEKQFDSFMHEIDDEGNICIYGIKLIKKYKSYQKRSGNGSNSFQ